MLIDHSIGTIIKKRVKGYRFLSFARNLSNKYGKQLLDTATKTGVDALKTAFKKVVHKASEATVQFIANKIVDKIAKAKSLPDAELRDIEEIIVLSEKRE